MPTMNLRRRKSKSEDAYHCNGTFDTIPVWRRGNPHIQHKFRLNMRSWGDVLRSLLHWHNETLNIWTHIFGLFMMAYLVHDALTDWLADADAFDRFLFLAFACGQSCQMAFSALFHSVACFTKEHHKWGARLDYIGKRSATDGKLAS